MSPVLGPQLDDLASLISARQPARQPGLGLQSRLVRLRRQGPAAAAGGRCGAGSRPASAAQGDLAACRDSLWAALDAAAAELEAAQGPEPDRLARECRAGADHVPARASCRPRCAGRTGPRSSRRSASSGCSIETRSSLERCRSRRVAPGSHRARRTSFRTSLFRPPAPPARLRVPGPACCGSGQSARRPTAAQPHSGRRRTWLGFAMPGRVAEGDLFAPGAREPALRSQDRLLGHLPFVGTTERDGDHALAAQPSARARPITRSSPSSDSSTERFTFFRLWVSVADRKRFTSSNSRPPAS